MDRANSEIKMEMGTGKWVTAVPLPYPPAWKDYFGHWWRQWTGGCRLLDVEPLTYLDKQERACRVCKYRLYESGFAG